MAQIYALYKGDVNLCDGTIEEIAQKAGLRPKTVYFYSTPGYQKRADTKMALVSISENDDEDD